MYKKQKDAQTINRNCRVYTGLPNRYDKRQQLDQFLTSIYFL